MEDYLTCISRHTIHNYDCEITSRGLKKKCRLYSVFLISPSSTLLSYNKKNNGFLNFILVKFLLFATRKTVLQTYFKRAFVGMQTSTATMENSVEIPLKIANRTTL